MEPILVPDKDCSGVIGGEAVADECGVCEGLGKTGCDSTCGSTLQLDCEGECGGNTMRDCNNECNGTHHWEYFCEEYDSLENRLDLSTRTLTCFTDTLTGNCKPNTDSCLFIDCSTDTMYVNTVINCQGELPFCIEASATCLFFQDYLGDGVCDYLDTNCIEFDFDSNGEINDCNLIDCKGVHFSEDYCNELFGSGCTTGDEPWLGDGYCDEGDNEFLPLNFNCEEWNFDGGDCNSNSRISETRITKKWRDKK